MKVLTMYGFMSLPSFTKDKSCIYLSASPSIGKEIKRKGGNNSEYRSA